MLPSRGNQLPGVSRRWAEVAALGLQAAGPAGIALYGPAALTTGPRATEALVPPPGGPLAVSVCGPSGLVSIWPKGLRGHAKRF